MCLLPLLLPVRSSSTSRARSESSPRPLVDGSAPMHAYAACAYGQRFHDSKSSEDYERALVATKKAVELDRVWVGVLRAALEGKGVDNDLADFREGDAYKALRDVLEVKP